MFKKKLSYNLSSKMSNKLIKNVFVCLITLVLILSFIGNVQAIKVKASIGNGKMILRPEVGETIDRTIRVINDNIISVDIEVTGSGDLEDKITIVDDKFTLAPGEEKDARFKIKVNKAGDFDNRINVKFAPVDGSNAAGISAIVRIITKDNENKKSNNIFDWLNGDEEEVVTFGKKKNDDISEDALSNTNDNSILTLGGSATIILFIILLVVLYIAHNKIKKKRTSKSKKSPKEWRTYYRYYL